MLKNYKNVDLKILYTKSENRFFSLIMKCQDL